MARRAATTGMAGVALGPVKCRSPVASGQEEAGRRRQGARQRADVTRQTIIALEKGKYTPSLLLAFRLAHVLQVEITELFQYRPDAEG